MGIQESWDWRAAPVCLTVISLLSIPKRLFRLKTGIPNVDSPPPNSSWMASSGSRNSVLNNQFPHRFCRLVGCIALVMVSLAVTMTQPTSCGQQERCTVAKLFHAAECFSYLYCTVLASTSTTYRNLGSSSSAYILLSYCGVYTYRDLMPLVTYDIIPSDVAQGVLLWVKIALLGVTAIILPLTESQGNASAGDKVSPPEQTASLISKLTYAYLDPLIWAAYRSPSLPPDQFPPLGYSDRTENLTYTFINIDPLHPNHKNEHLIWGLLRVFRRQYFALFMLQTILTLVSFIAPLGLQQLLGYIETGGVGAHVRPWFWITWLLLGPLLRAIISQRYTYISSKILVRAEGILTQLLFQHSLRIRAHPGGDDPDSKNFFGQLSNLATTDLSNATAPNEIWIVMLFAPVHFALCIWFLYAILEWSALVGLAVMLVLIPGPGYLTRLLMGVSVDSRTKADARVQIVTETMKTLRMIKLYGWERRVKDRIADKRDEELITYRKSKMLVLLTGNLEFMIPLATMMTCYATFAIVMHRELTASTVFSSILVFEMLRQSLRQVMFSLPNIIRGKVSLDRLNQFLNQTELLDEFDARDPAQEHEPHLQGAIGFRDCMFQWSKDSTGNSFKLIVDQEVRFGRGALHLISGPTGSGKTGLLRSLLGEMHCVPSGSHTWTNLPRRRGVAYAPQESWVLSQSIKDNILFGEAYDSARYQDVIYQCGLRPDLALFEDGDQTEVGERGLTLSGGQQARITLARAVYSSAEIVLLDDILSALDTHTSRWIVEKCFKGPLMKERTVLIVSHHTALLRPLCSTFTTINSSGLVRQFSSFKHSVPGIITISPPGEATAVQGSLDVTTSVKTPPITLNVKKLTTAETVEQGHVKWPAFRLYLTSMSRIGVLFWATFFVLSFTYEGLNAFNPGYWSSQCNAKPASEVPIPLYLLIYGLAGAGAMLFYSSSFAMMTFGSLRASNIIHKDFMNAIMGTTFRWLDTTPTARVIIRATQDMYTVDNTFADTLRVFLAYSCSMLAKFCAVILFSPAFFVPAVCIATLAACFGQLYMMAQLPVKREMSNARAPVVEHFQTAIHGLASVRAYGAQEAFLAESIRRINRYSRAARVFYDLNRWICIRSETLGGLFTAGLAVYLVYGSSQLSPADAGFSMTMAIGFSSMILGWVRHLNGLELSGNSLERVLQYIQIEQESSPDRLPPAFWPASGDLVVKNLSARYSSDGPTILKNISFRIDPGQHISIVGRTGSGKSSLALALLRCIPTEGEVLLNGISTSTLSLSSLRSSVTIIPQLPELLSGTLRQNLDPLSVYDDVALNDALRSAGLFTLQEEISAGADTQERKGHRMTKLTLDTVLADAGGNVSVGQRQIIALARAMLRKDKLLILDEATSAIDYKTDDLVQSSIRSEFSDTTVIAIAHRLTTIMDFDKIMVLDDGHIVEFDTPEVLLNKAGGKLRALVEESPDRDKLINLVEDRMVSRPSMSA